MDYIKVVLDNVALKTRNGNYSEALKLLQPVIEHLGDDAPEIIWKELHNCFINLHMNEMIEKTREIGHKKWPASTWWAQTSKNPKNNFNLVISEAQARSSNINLLFQLQPQKKIDWYSIGINGVTYSQDGDFIWNFSYTLPIPSNCVNTIIFDHCIQKCSVPDAQKILKEFLRVLKPDGILYISTTDLNEIIKNYHSTFQVKANGKQAKSAAQRFNEQIDNTTMWLYDEEELINCVRQSGFDVIRKLTTEDIILTDIFQVQTKNENQLLIEVKKHGLSNISLLAVEHCTNSCQFCSTSSPFAPRKYYSVSDFLPWLQLLVKNNIDFSSISITGGEPFIHPFISDFITELRGHFPEKTLGLTTNFFWATPEKIIQNSSAINKLDGILISKYPNIVNRLGGEKIFNELVVQLQGLCPNVTIQMSDITHFGKWEIQPNPVPVRKFCSTSSCYVLRSDGMISHCAIGAGLKNRPEYTSILERNREYLYDLKTGTDGLLEWSYKYPFDLCSFCTFWYCQPTEWKSIN